MTEGKKVVIIAALLVLALIGIGRCSVGKKHDNSLGAIMSQDNPYTYKVGSVSVVGLVDDSVTLRVQPLATYSLFTEDILVCNREAIITLFEGKHNPLVLTYKTKVSRLVQGLGCHDLVRVDEMKMGATQ